MNALVAPIGGATERVPAGMEEKLVWSQKFGRISLSMQSEGWHARISMHVSALGAEFTVASGYKHATPAEAVDTCIARMLESLAMIAKGTA